MLWTGIARGSSDLRRNRAPRDRHSIPSQRVSGSLNIDRLIALLEHRLPGTHISVPGENRSVASIASSCPDIGSLLIVDDGDEVTIFLGRFTHCHFELDDEAESPMAAETRLFEEVADFIGQVLTEQIEFYGRGVAGGCRVRCDKPRSWFSRLLFGKRSYVWSGTVVEDV